MLTRRNFLGRAAVSPMLARRAVADAVRKASGITVAGIEPSNADLGVPHFGSDEQHAKHVLDTLRSLGGKLPDWKLEELRMWSKRVNALDPDLAALHSTSLAFKVYVQRHRNFDAMVREALDQPRRTLMRGSWLKRFKISWL